MKITPSDKQFSPCSIYLSHQPDLFETICILHQPDYTNQFHMKTKPSDKQHSPFPIYLSNHRDRLEWINPQPDYNNKCYMKNSSYKQHKQHLPITSTKPIRTNYHIFICQSIPNNSRWKNQLLLKSSKVLTLPTYYILTHLH